MPKSTARKAAKRQATKPTGIKKVIVQTTILVENDIDVSSLSLAEIDELIDTGDGIGAIKIVSEKPVPSNRIARELRAIGNDGTFFDHLTNKDA